MILFLELVGAFLAGGFAGGMSMALAVAAGQPTPTPSRAERIAARVDEQVGDYFVTTDDLGTEHIVPIPRPPDAA